MLDEHFAEFEKCFGNNPNGESERGDQGETGRFRCFSRQEIADRYDDLAVSWLHDENDEDEVAVETPEEIAALILSNLQSAMTEIEAVIGELIEPAEVKK